MRKFIFILLLLFSGQAAAFEFEWRASQPINLGLGPSQYTNDREQTTSNYLVGSLGAGFRNSFGFYFGNESPVSLDLLFGINYNFYIGEGDLGTPRSFTYREPAGELGLGITWDVDTLNYISLSAGAIGKFIFLSSSAEGTYSYQNNAPVYFNFEFKVGRPLAFGLGFNAAPDIQVTGDDFSGSFNPTQFYFTWGWRVGTF